MIPAGRNQSNFAMLIPGMTSATTDYGGTNNLVLATVSIHGSRVGDQRIMVDGMSVSATSSNGELSNFVPDMTSTQEVGGHLLVGLGRAGVRRRPDEPRAPDRRQPVQRVALRDRHERALPGEELHGRAEARRTDDAQLHQARLRRQPRRRRADSSRQAVVLFRGALAVDADVSGRSATRTRTRGTPRGGTTTPTSTAGPTIRWSRRARTLGSRGR